MSEKTMTPEALMDLWRRVNPGKVCVPPSLYVLDFARAVLREYCNGSVTEREAVLRERKAFERGAKAFGAKWFISGSVERQAHKDQAAKDYPLPVRRRPLTVELSDGSQWRRREGSSIVDSLGPFANCSMYSLRNRLVTADDFRAIARMLDNETEEVPEGEE